MIFPEKLLSTSIKKVLILMNMPIIAHLAVLAAGQWCSMNQL